MHPGISRTLTTLRTLAACARGPARTAEAPLDSRRADVHRTIADHRKIVSARGVEVLEGCRSGGSRSGCRSAGRRSEEPGKMLIELVA